MSSSSPPLVAPAPTTPRDALRARRRDLMARFPGPVLLAAGEAPARNYPANVLPFRATSHFLYFVGEPIERAMLLFDEGRATVFVDPPDAEDALWHGPRRSLEAWRERLGVEEVRPLAEVAERVAAMSSRERWPATLPPQDAHSAAKLSEICARVVSPGGGASLEVDRDAALAEVVIGLRLRHDEAALAQLRFSAAVSVEAHRAGMGATRPGGSERDVYAAMVDVLRRRGCDDAYPPIVTVAGEVLHQRHHEGTTRAGDLLLADVGGESPEGWAADITRTWPVSGRFSATQRAIYDIVLDAQRRAVARVTSGRRYREVHDTAKRALVEGLVGLGILRGEVDGLLERGAASLFFPHGVGHIIGLDVHDMEDLGDRAGYAPGRERSPRFGDAFLRLDRDLVPGMAVTVEPGFYQVPAILDDPRRTDAVGDDLRRDVLARFEDVRGIRIEDDVVVTTDGAPENLTAALPVEASAVEALVGHRRPA
ncbi:MAG: aminopeptidase P family protein [Myxococcota bacterium]